MTEPSKAPIARLPEPPYYAVVFVSLPASLEPGYSETAERMLTLATGQPGFLGVDSARSPDGLGITVSYWESEASIAAWKAHAEHQLAQQAGRRLWYADYSLHVARVERSYRKPRAES